MKKWQEELLRLKIEKFIGQRIQYPESDLWTDEIMHMVHEVFNEEK
jgi:hypothetical protein